MIKASTTSKVPVNYFQASIFDSCPGKSTIPIFVRAFTAQIESKALKALASIVIVFLYGAGGILNL